MSDKDEKQSNEKNEKQSNENDKEGSIDWETIKSIFNVFSFNIFLGIIFALVVILAAIGIVIENVSINIFALVIQIIFAPSVAAFLITGIRSQKERYYITYRINEEVTKIKKSDQTEEDEKRIAIQSRKLLFTLFISFLIPLAFYISPEIYTEQIAYVFFLVAILGLIIFIILQLLKNQSTNDNARLYVIYWDYVLLFLTFFMPLSFITLNDLPSNVINFISNHMYWVKYFFPLQNIIEIIAEFNKETSILIQNATWRIILFEGLILIVFCLLLLVRQSRIKKREFKFVDFGGSNNSNNILLLLHGGSSSHSIWSKKIKTDSSITIFDFLNKEGILNKYSVYGIDFTDKLNNSLDAKYKLVPISKPSKNSTSRIGWLRNKIARQDNEESENNITDPFFPTNENNYVIELYLALKHLNDLHKEGSDNVNIHIISHSTSGVIIRRLIDKLYENNDPLVKKITQISWLACPHKGAWGGSASFYNLAPSSSMSKALNLAKKIPFVAKIMNGLGQGIVALIDDSQAALQLNKSSRFMQDIGFDTPTLYPDIIWKNAIASYDRVVGEGAVITKFTIPNNTEYCYDDFVDAVGSDYVNDRRERSKIEFEQKIFLADHADMIWEELEQAQAEKFDIPAIHHSKKVFEWIIIKEQKLNLAANKLINNRDKIKSIKLEPLRNDLVQLLPKDLKEENKSLIKQELSIKFRMEDFDRIIQEAFSSHNDVS